MSERADDESIRVVRLGHGANCSSLGSVVDTLFATAVLGSALYVAVAAALEREEVTRVAPSAPSDEAGEEANHAKISEKDETS